MDVSNTAFQMVLKKKRKEIEVHAYCKLNRLIAGEAFFRFIRLRKKCSGTACFSPEQEQPSGKTGTFRWHPVENPLPRDSPYHPAVPSGESSSISFLLRIVTTIAWNFSPLSGRKYVSLAADKKLSSSGKETRYHAGL